MSSNLSETCFNHDILHTYQAFAIINVILGCFSSLCGAMVLFILLRLGKHLFYRQRLVMYLNCSVVLQGLVSIISINAFLHGEEDLGKSTYCTINGFLFNWSVLTQLIIIWWIAIDIFRINRFHINLEQFVTKFELFQVFTMFLLPSLLLIILATPVVNLYGPDGPLCDIQVFNYSNCEQIDSGYIALAVYRFFPFIFLIISVSILVLCICGQKQKGSRPQRVCNYQKREIEQIKRTTCELFVYIVIYLVLSIIPTVHYLVQLFSIRRDTDASLAIYFLYIATINLRGVAISLAFALDRDIWKRLKGMDKKSVLAFFCLQQDSTVSVYNNLYTSCGDSLDAKEITARKQSELKAKLV